MSTVIFCTHNNCYYISVATVTSETSVQSICYVLIFSNGILLFGHLSSSYSPPGPLVQRVSKNIMVVKCQSDSMHPLGFLHFSFQSVSAAWFPLQPASFSLWMQQLDHRYKLQYQTTASPSFSARCHSWVISSVTTGSTAMGQLFALQSIISEL